VRAPACRRRALLGIMTFEEGLVSVQDGNRDDRAKRDGAAEGGAVAS